MKRYLKNIIVIVLIGITCTGMYFTMDYVKDNQTTNTNTQEGMTPPDMNNNNMQKEGETTENNSNTPPEKPSGESSENGQNTPPTKPGETDSESDNTSTPPSKPDENNTESSERPSMPNNNEGNMPNFQNSSNTLETKYIIIFGVESLVLALLISYLIMSNLNKKGIKETFVTTDKIVIYVLLTLVLTGGFTFTDKLITENCFLNSSETSSDKKQNNDSNATGTNTNTTYKGVTEITSDTTLKNESYSSTDEDENALLISGKVSVTASDIEVTKTGDSDGGDATSFYGTNSAILAKGGSTLTISDATITTNATGANGVFSYGGTATTNNTSSDGTTVNISDSTITTTKDNSGGIMTTGGGITNATNLTITTSGTSSAAIRTDRGGGTVTVNKGTYTTNGKGSPTVYSTADVTVKNATLTSTKSEGIVIEGKNSVTLENVKLTSTNNTLNGKSTTYKNIFLYQSMSGDASDGTSSFTSKNSEIITNKGDTFYVTNTSSIINLTNNKITNKDTTGAFLRIQKDSWGSTGANGGYVTLNMTNQTATGDIIVDELSTLKMNITEKSSFTGSINTDNTAKSITLKLDKTSTLKLTADSYVTSLDNADETNSNIDFNGYKLYVNNKSIN